MGLRTDFPPPRRGEDEGGGLNGAKRLNSLNVLNFRAEDTKYALSEIEGGSKDKHSIVNNSA
jgi:hypothetical protein